MKRGASTIRTLLAGMTLAQREAFVARNPHAAAYLPRAKVRAPEVVRVEVQRTVGGVVVVIHGFRLHNTANGSWARGALIREKLRVKRTVAAALLGVPLPPVPCRVVMVRVGPRKVDPDAPWHMTKYVQDTVARALGVDDGDPRVAWEARAERGPYAVRVEVTHADVAGAAEP